MQALRLAERGRGRTHPNPMVGALVVRDGVVVGEGYHAAAGLPHAEVVALQRAGERARGADLFVTLEPCCHEGKTPPCTDAIIKAGIKRVVVAMQDPFPAVAGRGIRTLREAGIAVEVGLCEQEARRLNKHFLIYVLLQRPFVTWKYAMTLDGRIATSTGDARWITGTLARQKVHELRNEVQAIITGVGTVLADDPQLTVRLPEEHPARARGIRNPLRIVLDSKARTPVTARMLDEQGETWIVVSDQADERRCEALREAGAHVIRMPTEEDPLPGSRIHIPSVLELLAAKQIVHVLLECGQQLAGSFFTEQFIDEVLCFQAPMLIGGQAAPGPLGGRGVARIADARRLHHVHIETFGDDLLVRGDLNVHWLS